MKKRLVSILFVFAILFSLTAPAFAETSAETPIGSPIEAPTETLGGGGGAPEMPASAPADAPAPAPQVAAPAAAENAPAPAGDNAGSPAPAAATAAPVSGGNDASAAAPAAPDASGEGTPAAEPAAAASSGADTGTPAAEPAQGSSAPAGEGNAEGGSEKAAASAEKAGTAEGQEKSAAEPAQGSSGDETPADEQKEASEAAGEDEKKPAEEAGEDEKKSAEEAGEGEKEPAEGADEGEKEPAKEEGEDEKEPAEDDGEDLALGGALSNEENALKDAEQTEGGADADGGDVGQEAVGGGQAAGSSQNSDIYTLVQNLNAGSNLKAYIAGMSAESSQRMMDTLQASVDQAIKDNKPLKITDMALPDAEKYMLSGYDQLLCWAATAANMLWTSQIAQQSVNPATNTNFQTVDEVFDYFRTIFTDEVGRPDGALSVFLKGTYPFQNSAGISQLKDPNSVSKRLPDEIKTPDFGLFNLQGENAKDIAEFEKLDIQSLGVLLHSYDNEYQKMGGLAHWVTSPGIVIDNTKTGLERFKAILIADSDNDPINGDDSIPNAEKAAKAANAPNSYTVYPLTLKTYSTIGQRWTIPFYTRPDQSDFDVLIDWVAFVASIQPATKESEDILPGDEDDWDDDGWDEDDWDYEWEYDENDEDEPAQPASEGSGSSPYVPMMQDDDVDWDEVDWDEFDWDDFDWDDLDMDELDEFLNAVPADRLPELIALAKAQDGGSGLLEALKIRMAAKNLEVFSPADWKYSLAKDGTFLVVVRTDPTQLLNVLLDGRLLTEYKKDFEVIDENTGTFLLVFSEAVMQGLEAGEHTLTLEINGIGELVRTITVVK